MENSKAIRIKSIQANSLFRVNCGVEGAFLDLGDATINDSLFSNYMKKHGVMVKNNKSVDFIVMKFEYGVKGNIDCRNMSAKELRLFYYKNGANVTWQKIDKKTGKPIIGAENTIHYKMLMRTPGKAKDGDCVFIREDLLETARKFLTMGLYDKMPKKNSMIVEMSAYSTLTTATALDFITIPLENILILKDEEVTAKVNAVSVKVQDVIYENEIIDYNAIEYMINELGYTFYKKKIKKYPHLKHINKSVAELKANGINYASCPKKKVSKIKQECCVDRKGDKKEVVNTIWDGMGLIDDSIFPEENGMQGFIYCRSHFFKSCLFRGSLQQYFKDYYKNDYETATITDMFGNEMSVKDIKVIITDNSIKWLKFKDLMGNSENAAYQYYKRFMSKHGNEFEIIKTAHSSKWGEIQRSSYQINSSLPCTDREVLKNIAKLSLDYCNSLKTDHNAFIRHLEMTSINGYSINNVLIALDRWNEKFKHTQYFKSKKNSIISKLKNDRLKLGKLFQYGDNLTICGNPIALLKKATNQDFIQEGCFEVENGSIQCYTTRFQEGECIAGFRSPHNAPNNIVHLHNVYPLELKKYFSRLGNNIIVINGIGTDIQSRLNGQDLDSDGIYATNQSDIVNLAKDAYLNFPTIINEIPYEKNSIYNKDMESFAIMDNKISSAQFAIGYSSNIAQLALCYYYNDGSTNQELEDVFIICSVLAQVAIDSAKRSFVINVNSELNRIQNLECMKREDGKLYPSFYADIQKQNDKKKKIKIDNNEISHTFNCPMQILYDIISEEVIDLRKFKEYEIPTYDLSTIFRCQISKKRDSKQHKKIIGIVQQYDSEVNCMDKSEKDYYIKRSFKFNDCMNKISKLRINEYTMSSLIKYAFVSNGDICDRLLTVLYERDNNMFLNCFLKGNKDKKSSDKTA